MSRLCKVCDNPIRVGRVDFCNSHCKGRYKSHLTSEKEYYEKRLEGVNKELEELENSGDKE